MTFLSKPNFSFQNSPITHSFSLFFIIPLALLSLGAVVFGDLSSFQLGITSTSSLFIYPSFNGVGTLLNTLVFCSFLTLIPLFLFLFLFFI